MQKTRRPVCETGAMYDWFKEHRPRALCPDFVPSHTSRWHALVRVAARLLWKAFALVADLVVRWGTHAAARVWSSEGYVTIGLILAAYGFLYSLANESFQRGELTVSIRLGSFLTLVSGGSRSAFVAAVADLGAVQDAQSFEPPSFWLPNTWFVKKAPNRLFVRNWAASVFPECTAESCGSRQARIAVPGARWDGAYLWHVDLHGIDLSRASLVGAELDSANLSGGDLTQANLWSTSMTAVDFKNVRLSCARIISSNGSTFIDIEGDLESHFDSAIMTGVQIDSSNFEHAIFDDANFGPGPCVHFGEPSSELGRRLGPILVHSQFTGSNARGAKFRRAKLNNVDFRGTDLQEADLSGADLSGAILDETRLRGTILDGATYSPSTRWPTGFSPEAAGARRHSDEH